MKVLRSLLFVSLVSCGGFLPFLGDDDDDAPPALPPPGVSAEGSSDPGRGDPSDASTANDTGLVGRDTGLAQDDAAVVGCKAPPGRCVTASSCCPGSICGTDASCCVPGGLYAAQREYCCGDGEFAGFTGWRCLDTF